MNEITFYKTTTCPYCFMVTDFLKEKKIDFKEINVQENPEIIQEIVNETGQSVYHSQRLMENGFLDSTQIKLKLY